MNHICFQKTNIRFEKVDERYRQHHSKCNRKKFKTSPIYILIFCKINFT